MSRLQRFYLQNFAVIVEIFCGFKCFQIMYQRIFNRRKIVSIEEYLANNIHLYEYNRDYVNLPSQQLFESYIFIRNCSPIIENRKSNSPALKF
jgi:hypothetical protein